MNTTLYRFFANDGELLYVGITNSMEFRLGQHQSDKPWWHLVASMTVQEYGTRPDARAAEIRAIQIESPAFNRADRAPGDPPRFAEHGLRRGAKSGRVQRDHVGPIFRVGTLVPIRQCISDWLYEVEKVYLAEAS